MREEAQTYLPFYDDRIMDKALSKMSASSRARAATQYGMGFIVTDRNKIIFRDDSMPHSERVALANELNHRMKLQ